MKSQGTPLLGFAAWSGTGKTTLLSKLIPLLRKQGLRIALVKHAHHDFDIDHPGKDSYRLRKAGAEHVVVASNRRLAMIREIGMRREEPSLQEALVALDLTHIDLVLVEGFKHERIPKIELYRHSLDKPLLHRGDPTIIAIASDTPVDINANIGSRIDQLDIDDPGQIAEYIMNNIARLKTIV
jgi:molybdopterin-guanine dinucleotide biosynthesis protein MobB